MTYVDIRADTAALMWSAVTTESDGNRLIVELAGDIDCANAGIVETQVAAVLTARRPSHVLIDLSAVEFCDAAGVRMLVALHHAAVSVGASYGLCRPRAHIRWLLETLDAGHLVRTAADGDG
jgi:anti-sigma B factor antagonist